MAEIVDFGLQQHKIKMDSRYFENVLSVVAGDTGRRIEVQLLDTNGMVQDTRGLNLRLNALIAGKTTFTDATLIDAATGKYQLDLSNGMFLAPGNWQFQWQITDSAGKKLHSFAFTGNVGSNISEGGSQATNFYVNLEDLKAMQEDFINGTFDSAALETNIAGKLTTLETEYAPRLTEVTAQVAQKANESKVTSGLNTKIAKGGSIRKPVVSFVLDDGPTSDYTVMKEKLDLLGIKPTTYINPNGGVTKLSDEQLIALYNDGWDIGSHTTDHIFMGLVNGSAPFSSGQTTIEVFNNVGYKYFEYHGDSTELQIQQGESGVFENVRVASVGEISGGRLAIQLAKPLTNNYANPTVRYSDDFITEQLKQPVEYLNRLNIPCNHFAYPYGSYHSQTKRLVGNYYSTGRKAIDRGIGTVANGGITRGVENRVDSFALECADMGSISTQRIDEILADTLAKSGHSIFLGHTNSLSTFESQLEYLVDRCNQLGIEILPMDKAMKYHENLIDLNGFSVSKAGVPYGGINILPIGSVKSENHSIWSYPIGVSIARSENVDNGGFPTTDGTFLNIRSSSNAETQGFNPQFWFTKNGKMYHRNSASNNTYTTWKKMAFEQSQTYNFGTLAVGGLGKAVVDTGINVGTNNCSVIVTPRADTGMLVIRPSVRGGSIVVDFLNLKADAVNSSVGTCNISIFVHD